ncbi:hypothetical protein Xen7305DRAFT_00016150 [Xenococcus sp. PCC 7305]|uniref:hypothetical protein n=1 Tax=Xenococcus sp. PCC 7305 TaxID=102125 RepID=UPI0002ACDB6A|nr:hypothetical protein [Xenococcus sp. PCC 7305]ELS01908.1 hypothetical protein Xen7305DRAFT_00016150 [Xenococcus sp. PCC 7305]
MKLYTEYLYSFANASLTLRVIEYLRSQKRVPVDSVIVVNLIDRWLIKIKLKHDINYQLAEDFQSFLNEMGIVHQPSPRLMMALLQLEAGESPTEVMNRYKIVIVANGQPEQEEIEIFRHQLVSKLGYCPQTMA